MFDKFEIGSYDSEDFRTGNLPAEFLEDSNFSDCLFTGRKFENQLFYGYYCCNSDFKETTFLNCHITKINCDYNNYSNAYFENTRFLRVELYNAVFKGAYFKNVSFIACYINNTTDFSNCIFDNVELKSTALDGSIFHNVTVKEISVEKKFADSINIGSTETPHILYGDEAYNWLTRYEKHI
ncbi:MAG: pentapeptide repeat-containing protein [Oscillospiraceae bacterium]|nr:pentapeptide repeat-containing protein [Oscillospiraceae bacterium]